MAREDFREKIEELNRIGIVKVCTDFHHAPNNKLFVKSPATSDKSWSMKLYPATNTFCDFANGNKGGDIVRLVAYIQNIDNWQALKLLQEYYGLSDSLEQDREEQHRKILRQQEEQRRQQERHKAFQSALFGEIDRLKAQEGIYTALLNKGLYEPFSDAWTATLSDLQRVQYKLDILCAADQSTYRRMKPDVTRGIGSDRPEWLLDVLTILKECGAFQATQAEIREIQEQYAFEICHRSPGKDRGCKLLW